MRVDVARLRPEGEHYSGEEPAAILELEDHDDIRAEAPVHYDFIAQVVSGKLLARGALGVTIGFTCSRCAAPFRAQVTEPRFEAFLDVPDPTQPVDLTGEIREAIILRFPNHPVCEAECRGLCPRCGANLNRGPCKCPPRPRDDRWRELEELKLE